MRITEEYIDELVGAELSFDIGSGDITSETVLSPDSRAEGLIIAKADGVVAGLDFAVAAFKNVSQETFVEKLLEDGDEVHRGTHIAKISGDAIAVLSAERTALNFLGHLSGIATLTKKFVKAVEGTGAKILDTRKTTPGLRLAEKYAVKCGGGKNHRIGLFDMILVKDNHIAAAGGIENVLERLYSHAEKPPVPVEIEVTNLSQLEIALQYPVDRIMLDNFSPQLVKKAVELRKKFLKKIPFECSGRITLDTVREYAEAGVEFISVGAITHSAKQLDISLEIEIF
ncbi:carboxylating nicotinate-nucleotide diphosphorylase [bacterium]|nr:carboxylating nicotinate-nucleotide diphosphorylase [bacterium]